jgi:two-component system response regulator FixJ
LISQDSELEGEVSFRVGGESLHPSRVNSLDDLVDAASAIAAGCAVVDTTSPQIDPGRLEQLLSTQAIEIPTMVIVRAGDVQNAVRLMKAGATHVLEKRAGGRCLIEQINEQLAGEAHVLRQQMSRNEIRRRLDKLTAGERAVLEGVVAGKPNKSIASQLGFSLRTIELWRRNVMNKLEVESVAELVKLRMQLEPNARPHLRPNGHHHYAGNLTN